VRHKRDDEYRSPDFDKLVTAEQAYVVLIGFEFSIFAICGVDVLVHFFFWFQVLLVSNEESILRRRCNHRNNPRTSRRWVLDHLRFACVEINGVTPRPVES